MKKQLLIILLATLLPLAAWADVWQDPETKVNYEYIAGSGEASVKAGQNYFYLLAGSPDVSGNINILSSFTVNGSQYTVTSIGSSAFYNCRGLTSVTIPECVTSIGDHAFYVCSGLTSVTIPSSVTSIGSSAFYNCRGLTSVTIPSSVTEIGGSAFCFCSGLTSVTIPEGVTSIGDYAFAYCHGLTSVTIPSSVTSIGSFAFAGCDGLTSVNIPSSVTNIGNYAFASCDGLTSVTIPSSVTSIGDHTFFKCTGLTLVTILEGVTTIGSSAFRECSCLTSVTIPSSVTSIGDYTFFECTGLTLVTILEGVTTIGSSAFSGCSCLTSVTIPSSVTYIGDGAFSGCIGLTSVTSLIMEPFAISGGFSSRTYDTATLYVPAGTIDAYKATDGWKNFKNIVEIVEMGGSSLTLTVAGDDGSNLTDKVGITWYDADGKQIGTGKSLSGIEDGMEVYYSVALGEELGRIYREVKMQKVVADGNAVTCQLEKIGRVMLEGRVSAIDIDKTTATINVKQMLNGKWEQNYTTQTNEQGVFSVEVYDDETDITVSGEGYLDATLHRDGFSGNGNVGTIPVSMISGFAIAANITMKNVVADGEAEETAVWTDGLSNIDFMLTNTTTGTAITDFTIQNGNIVIKSGAGVGHKISLTAKSKQGVFADATTTFTIAEGANCFDLQLTELGGVDVTCAGSRNGSTVGYLYGGDGTLVAKGGYAGETLSIRHLKSGSYTLVSMGMGSLLGNMTHLSDLPAIGLVDGSDYVTTSVSIADGQLTAVSVSEVPRLDETRFYYTSENTYFNVNKASVTAGNYLTLQAHVDFKPEYAGKADGVTLTIDLPEGCEMVENSVIANRQAVPHSVNGNRVTMTLNSEQYDSQVCFCIIPTLNQSYTVTAMASFDMNGQMTQPIGTAQFEVKGLSLSMVEQTANTYITINGTAKGHSEVSVYDNDVLIGKTESKADGSWTAQCELYKSYSHSFHDIYAKVVTDGGMELTSETKQVEYDKNSIVPTKVTMLYRSYNVIFDLLEGTTSPSYYSYVPGISDFTFLADFTRNDSTIVKNVNIKVLNSDGTVRTLPAVFDGKQNKWVATTKYSSSSRLAQNVAVEYVLIPAIMSDADHNEGLLDMTNMVINCASHIDQYVQDHVEMELVSESDEESVFACKMDDKDYTYQVKEIDYALAEEMMSQYQFVYMEDEEGIIGTYTELDDEMIKVTGVDITQRQAYQITYFVTDDNQSSRRRVPVMVSAVAGGFMEVFGLKDYWNVNSDMENMVNLIKGYTDSYAKIQPVIMNMILAKCPNGDYRLNSLQMIDMQGEMELIKIKQNFFEEKYYKYIDEYKRCLLASLATEVVTFGIGKKIESAFKGAKFVWSDANKWIARHIRKWMHPESSAEILSNTLGAVLDGIEENTENSHIFDYKNFGKKKDFILSWASSQHSEILSRYIQLRQDIEQKYKKCENEEYEEDKPDNNDDFNGKGSTPQIDPSGYVYEAVMSNRLEGVTATCYQKVTGEDMYGDVTEEVVVWNAADYSQVNPQLTDETGFYRWDVPQGMWQVKYEKAGYETAYSEWLPVPPPQLDVNIGMKQSTPPTVEKMRGTESGIIISMSKYMRPETLNEGSVTVTRNGMTEKGHIELLNLEQEPRGSQSFASKLKFVPEFRFRTSDEVYVTVHQNVESYCGVKMAQNHTEKVEIESEITDIVADSTMTVAYQDTRDIQVLVMPKEAAAGRVLTAQSSSPMIASLSSTQATIDANGLATLTLSGELPGGVVLTLGVDGTDVTTTSKVQVVIGRELTAMPVASIRNGEQVAEGTKLVLTCSTPGATIYYTLDGSCPCNTETRRKYTGPIALPKGTVTVKAMAVADDMDESDVATFIYVVGMGDGIDTAQAQNLEMVWHDGQLAISGAEGGTVRVYDIEGREIASRNNVKGKISIQMAGRPVTCTYIVCVTTRKGHTLVQKVTVP